MQVKCIESGRRELQSLLVGALFKVPCGTVVYIKIMDANSPLVSFKTSVVSLPNGWLYSFDCTKQVIEYEGNLTAWPKGCKEDIK